MEINFKALIENILLYFLKVFAYFGYATEEDVKGFEGYVNGEEAAE